MFLVEQVAAFAGQELFDSEADGIQVVGGDVKRLCD